MAYIDGELIQTLTNPSGTKKLELVRRPDGAGRFVEYARLHDQDTGDYWGQTRQSGLYPSVSEALADARLSIGWLSGDG